MKNAAIWRKADIRWLVVCTVAIGMFIGVALCCVLTLISTAEAEEDFVYDRWVLCQPGSEVLIRSRPDRRGEIVGSVTCGDCLHSDDREKNGYLHLVDVSNETGEGWISLRYIVYTEPKELNSEAVITGRGRVACRAYIDGKRKGWAAAGSVVTVYWISDEWAVTDRGYISCEWLEVP